MSVFYCGAHSCANRHTKPVDGKCPACGHRRQFVGDDWLALLSLGPELKAAIADSDHTVLQISSNRLAELFRPIDEDAPDHLRAITLEPDQQYKVYVLWKRTRDCQWINDPEDRQAVVQAIDTLTSPPKGKPGRRGYPVKALEYARKLRTKYPDKKAKELRAECLKKFSEDDLPPTANDFRRWINRKSNNRAN